MAWSAPIAVPVARWARGSRSQHTLLGRSHPSLLGTDLPDNARLDPGVADAFGEFANELVREVFHGPPIDPFLWQVVVLPIPPAAHDDRHAGALGQDLDPFRGPPDIRRREIDHGRAPELGVRGYFVGDDVVIVERIWEVVAVGRLSQLAVRVLMGKDEPQLVPRDGTRHRHHASDFDHGAHSSAVGVPLPRRYAFEARVVKEQWT